MRPGARGSAHATHLSFLADSLADTQAFYMSPDADLVDRPFEIFTQLTAADKMPIHVIVCLADEYK
jgi:hypothetical protein